MTCPYWFTQHSDVISWVGDTLLGPSTPSLVQDVVFLQSGFGRGIDSIGMALATGGPAGTLDWCALEIGVDNFYGGEADNESRRIREQLLFQLQAKVPILRHWGKKMAVVVDRPFFDAIGHMPEIPHISNGDIAWFVIKLEEDAQTGSHRIVRDGVYVTTLERATEGLTGGNPVSKEEFENRIRAKFPMQ